MNDAVKVAVAAIVAAVCALMVRKQVPEIGLLLTCSASLIILICCSDALTAIIDLVDKLARESKITSSLLLPVLKVTGIAIVTRLSAELCKDANEGALAFAVEFAGTVISLFVIMPLLTAVAELLEQLL